MTLAHPTLSDRDNALSTYSDVHKDVYGFRPHGMDWSGAPASVIWDAVDDLHTYHEMDRREREYDLEVAEGQS